MRVEIQVVTGPAQGQHFTFDKPARLLFGRAADAQIAVPNDQYVSRQHFLLEIVPPECILTDLNSKNGVIVNGVRYGGQKPSTKGVQQAPPDVKEVRLKHGDEIVVGDTQINVLISTEVDAQTVGADANRLPQIVRCRFCGQALTDSADSVLQAEPADVCLACRKKTSQGELKNLLDQAVADKTRPVEGKSAGDGFNLAGYQIIHELKYGGFGKAYKAKNLQNGQFVTIKILPPEERADAYQRNIVQREIAILRQLNHKHIVRLLEHGQTEGVFYIIFEFGEGVDLAQFIRSKGGRVALAEAAPIMLDLLDGLAYAHQARIMLPDAAGQEQALTGVVHRNLKPQNILLLRQGARWIPKIADFGLAKAFAAAGLTNITTPGDVFGTPVYWPREQMTHYRYLTPVSDVFAIGAVFYEMLTGVWVREGFTELARQYKQPGPLPAISDYLRVIAANPPIPIRQRQPNIPEPLAQVIDQALQETALPDEPAEMQAALRLLRYPDAGAFRSALVQAFAQIGAPQTAGMVRERSRAPADAGLTGKEAEPATPLPEAVMYSVVQPASQREVALFVLDLAESTQYVLQKGDTEFSTLIGSIFRRIKTHASASEMLFLKCVGDGYLAAFRTMPAAYALAASFLETPLQPEVQVRMALHWGMVKINPEGDVLGTEVARVSQMEGVSIQDQMAAVTDEERFLRADRIVATTQALKRLDDATKARFRPAGKFRLKGFEHLEHLWISPK